MPSAKNLVFSPLFSPYVVSKKIRYFYKKNLWIIRRSVRYLLDWITSRIAQINKNKINEFGAFSDNSVTTILFH